LPEKKNREKEDEVYTK